MEEERFVELFEAVEATRKPAVVVMQEIGRNPGWAAHSGEVMATIFSSLGAIGLITDCAVRDLSAVRRLPFHYFARGAVSSHAHFRIVRSNVPVEVLGMTCIQARCSTAMKMGSSRFRKRIASRLAPRSSRYSRTSASCSNLSGSLTFGLLRLRGRFLH